MFQRGNHSHTGFYICILVVLCLTVFGLLVPLPKARRLSSRESALASYRLQQYGNLPISFEPNRRQFDPEFGFLGRGANYELLLKPDAAVLKMRGLNP